MTGACDPPGACDLPGVAAQRLIGAKRLAPSELLASCNARIGAVDHAVNATVARDFSWDSINESGRKRPTA
jgi:hypothetical protein